MQKVLSQRRSIYSEENNQGYQKSGVGEWPIKNNKQIQCVIPTLTTPVFNRKMSVKISTSNSQQGDIQSCQTSKARCNNFPKIIIPRQMKTNIIPTQVEKRLRLNYLHNGSLALDAYTNDKNTKRQMMRMKEDFKERFQGKEISVIFALSRWTLHHHK